MSLASTALMDDEDHQEMAFREIAGELGIQAPRSTLEKVVHKQHKIYQCSLPLTLALTPDNMRELGGDRIHELIGGAQTTGTSAYEKLRGFNRERNSL